MKKLLAILIVLALCPALAFCATNKKITALTALGETPADGDLLAIVDISDTTDAATGTTKKVTALELIPDATDTVKGKSLIAKDIVTTAPITGGTDNVLPGADSDLTIAITQADTDTDGYISQTDWDTFNNKQATMSGGDAITLDGATIDFDGGATPAGELGNTWASPTIDDSLAVTSWNLTTATMTGINILADAATWLWDLVLAGDETQTGITSSQTMGTTVAHGDVLYLAVADSRWEFGDASASGTSYGLVMALGAGSDGNSTTVLHYGVVRQDTDWNWTIGSPIYLTITGTTTNTLSQTPPSGNGEQVVVIGYALTADSIFFSPSLVLVEVVV